MFKNYFKKIYKARLKKINEKSKIRIENERNKYISILNHDIKTALLAQIQALELYLNNKAPKEILYEILNSSEFLYEIVKNTIFLSNYERQKKNLKLENIDIEDIISEVKKSVESLAKYKNQNIILKTNSKNITLKADKLFINKIIHNIITSSISYGFENSDIEISVKESKDKISFKTKNKSIYMTKEKIKNILEDKKTNDLNQLGMSLNLNIANKLISAHKWNIIADSKQDNSSVFGFVAKK
ncbi:MAG: HAMP domain-containing histidine kinase [Candidatus Gastranaerophilales bacterium]|nr:HAMP domain-containing histidine kinase [Candidatus Gastranaerophilales bacterium]